MRIRQWAIQPCPIGASHAFLYSGGVLFDLNNLIGDNLGLDSWTPPML